MREHRPTLRIMAALLTANCVLLAAGASRAADDKKEEKKTGTLEGMTVSEDGKVLTLGVQIYKNGTKVGANLQSDHAQGGLYSAELEPGTYEVRVFKLFGDDSVGYRPQRFFGVEIKPGVRTVLKLKFKLGEAVEEIGKSDLPTEKVDTVLVELERLKKEVEAQKKEIEALKKEIEALKKR